MVGKKGFIHVIEAVLVSILAISTLPYLMQTSSSGSDWEEIQLRKTGEDILISLEKSGQLKNISNYNQSETQNLINSILGERSNSIQYNLKEVDSYRKSIRIGFNCTSCNIEDERKRIYDIFTPIWLNGRLIEFQISEFSWDRFQERQMVSGRKFDLIFINSEEQATNVNQTKLEKHIAKGGGVVEYADISDPNQDLQNEIFGLEDGPTGTQNMTFKNRGEPEKQNYDPGKLFYGTGSTVLCSGSGSEWQGSWDVRGESHEVNVTDSGSFYSVEIGPHNNLIEGDSFTVDSYNFTLERVQVKDEGYYQDKSMVWIRHEKEYDFQDFSDDGVESVHQNGTVLSDGTESGMVVNKANRAAWVSKGSGDDVKGLVQSAALWTTKGEQWKFLRSPSSNSVQINYFTARKEEIYEPYKVVMNLWYIY